MAKLFRRSAYAVTISLVIFFGLNFFWTRAALAVIWHGHECQRSFYQQAEQNVEGLFGSFHAKPIVGCLNQPSLGLNVSHGSASFAPFLPAILILGPQGLNLDVVSHELAHAELADRLGVVGSTYFIPTWFNEGIAMQVDQRTPYSRQALRQYVKRSVLNLADLETLSTPSQFYVRTDLGKAHYALAKCVVSKWLSENQVPLESRLEGLGLFKHFPSSEFVPHFKTCMHV